MCGRYICEEEEEEDIRIILRRIRESGQDKGMKTGEIRPTDIAPIITGEKPVPCTGIWGFPTMEKNRLLINARAETVMDKRAFRDGFLHRRCVIPTTGYFEWSAKKEKYRFNLPETRVLYLGGFYRIVDDRIRFVICTTEPSFSAAFIHDRMPVILTKEKVRRYLSDKCFAAGCLAASMPDLIPTLTGGKEEEQMTLSFSEE